MSNYRWVDQTQPQTLYIAVILLYVNAAFMVLFGGLRVWMGPVPIGLLLAAGQVGGGLGVANEKKWGYGLAVAVAILPLALLILGGGFATDIITLLFQIALVCLLLHPQSREYQRIWFK
jgi:hypothetical protein